MSRAAYWPGAAEGRPAGRGVGAPAVAVSGLTAVLVAALLGGVVAAALTALGRVGAPRPLKYAPANRTEELDRARRVRNARSERMGAVLLALAILVWPVGVIAKAALEIAGYRVEITYFVMATCAALLTRGHQMRAKDALWVLEHDPRPPVVYLRPFATDQVSRESIEADLFWKQTDEQRMAAALRHVAPFVALGDPTELLPGLGAGRLYADDAEWQGDVEYLTSLGGSLIIHAGDSPGLAWEVDHVVSLGQPERMIVWRDNTAGYAAFCVGFHPVFPGGLLEDAGFGRHLLFFDPDWTPQWLNRSTPVGEDQRSQVLAALRAEFSGLPLRRTRRIVRRWLAKGGGGR